MTCTRIANLNSAEKIGLFTSDFNITLLEKWAVAFIKNQKVLVFFKCWLSYSCCACCSLESDAWIYGPSWTPLKTFGQKPQPGQTAVFSGRWCNIHHLSFVLSNLVSEMLLVWLQSELGSALNIDDHHNFGEFQDADQGVCELHGRLHEIWVHQLGFFLGSGLITPENSFCVFLQKLI